MRSRTLSIIAVAVMATFALVATACSSDDNGGGAAVSAEAQPYVDALKTSMRDDPDDDLEISDEQIDCLAPKWISTIGVDRLKEHDVTPADLADDDAMDFTDLGLSETEGGQMYDAFAECDVNIRELMMAEFSEDEELPEAAKACMEGAFTDENLRKMMVTMLVKGEEGLEDDPEMAPLMGQLVGCMFMSLGDMDFDDMDLGDMDDQGGN